MKVETKSENIDKIWKKFLRNHWKIFVLFVVGAILAVVGAIFVYLWFVGDAQLTGLVPSTLGLWSMGHLVAFLIYLILWEILLIGVPLILAVAAIIFLWWKKLPDEEREEYKRKHLFGKSSRRSQGGEGISFLIFILFIIKVYLDGYWDVPFADWKFNYLVYTCLTAFLWVLIIFGIPILLGIIWWINHEMKKES
jgi:hypothetical protein